MTNKVTCIIQARMGSSRLPGKMILDLNGSTVLERVVERVRDSKRIDQIMVATTDKEDDDVIEKICKKIGIECFRGSENDVLDRYYQVAKKYDCKNIVRITGDCPVVDPEIIDKVVDLYFDKKLEYATNVIPHTYPDGLDTEIFSFVALEKAWKNVKLGSDREHVTTFIWGNPKLFKQDHVNSKEDLSKKRWTLDNEEDYVLIEKIYKELYSVKPKFRLNDVLEFLDENPEYEKINCNIKRNEGLIKSLQEEKI